MIQNKVQKLNTQTHERKMINRLVAEKTIKVPSISCEFSASKHFLVYSTETALRLRFLMKENQEIDLAPARDVLKFSVAHTRDAVYVLSSTLNLTIFIPNSPENPLLIPNVKDYTENQSGLILEFADGIIRFIPFKDILTRKFQRREDYVGMTKNDQKSCNIFANGKVFIDKQNSLQMYECHQGSYVKSFSHAKIPCILGIYCNRYAFSLDGSVISIVDLEDQIVKGTLPFTGDFRYFRIMGDLLVLITNFENTDYYTFYVLENSPNLITHKNVYEKGKADHHVVINLPSGDAARLIEKKQLLSSDEYTEWTETQLDENTTSLIFALSKNKEKIELIRLDHSRLLKCPFAIELNGKTVLKRPKVEERESIREKDESVQMDRQKMKLALNQSSRNDKASMKESQRKFVEHVIDTKLRFVMQKFDQLEKRVESLERSIKTVYEKMEVSLDKINRDQIRKSIETLFVDLTPQFEKYFSEIFKQVSTVMEQGATYYNLKLAKEAEMHKQALNLIVNETFDSTQEIISLSTKELEVSNRSQEALKKLLEAKKKWTKSSRDFEVKAKDAGKEIAEKKEFVRADLFQNGRKEG